VAPTDVATIVSPSDRFLKDNLGRQGIALSATPLLLGGTKRRSCAPSAQAQPCRSRSVVLMSSIYANRHLQTVTVSYPWQQPESRLNSSTMFDFLRNHLPISQL
jgi:hypothetical protein